MKIMTKRVLFIIGVIVLVFGLFMLIGSIVGAVQSSKPHGWGSIVCYGLLGLLVSAIGFELCYGSIRRYQNRCRQQSAALTGSVSDVEITRMGLFNRLFGKKPQEAPPERIAESVETMQQYLRGIMSHYGEAHFKGDTQPKQILAVYSFGGISALAMQHGMSQSQAHAVCLALFTKFFGFDNADAAAKAEAVITAAPDRTSHLYGIIHRGADGFVHWQQHSNDGAAKDFGEIMQHFKKVSVNDLANQMRQGAHLSLCIRMDRHRDGARTRRRGRLRYGP